MPNLQISEINYDILLILMSLNVYRAWIKDDLIDLNCVSVSNNEMSARYGGSSLQF